MLGWFVGTVGVVAVVSLGVRATKRGSEVGMTTSAEAVAGRADAGNGRGRGGGGVGERRSGYERVGAGGGFPVATYHGGSGDVELRAV